MMDTPLPSRDHIFISYRRDDARGASGRLYDWLRIGFGRERVFRDVASIGVGKWRDKIDAALAQSAVCVAVIGPRWANADNLPRLADESDMVRHELFAALNSDGLTMVPTLVEGAEVPKAATLPAVLLPLFDTWNARRVTEDGWEDDTRRLIAEIAEAARLSVGPDLDALLRDAGGAQQRIAELEQERKLQSGPDRSPARNGCRADAQTGGGAYRRAARPGCRLRRPGARRLAGRRRRLRAGIRGAEPCGGRDSADHGRSRAQRGQPGAAARRDQGSNLLPEGAGAGTRPCRDGAFAGRHAGPRRRFAGGARGLFAVAEICSGAG